MVPREELVGGAAPVGAVLGLFDPLNPRSASCAANKLKGSTNVPEEIKVPLLPDPTLPLHPMHKFHPRGGDWMVTAVASTFQATPIQISLSAVNNPNHG